MQDRVVDILLVHVALLVIVGPAMRFTRLSAVGLFGVYLILMPLGFQVLDPEADRWIAPVFGLVGVLVVFWSLRKGSVGQEVAEAEPIGSAAERD